MRSHKFSDLLKHKFEFAVWTRGMMARRSMSDLASFCVCPLGSGCRLDRVDVQDAVEDDLRLGSIPVEKRLRVEV